MFKKIHIIQTFLLILSTIFFVYLVYCFTSSVVSADFRMCCINHLILYIDVCTYMYHMCMCLSSIGCICVCSLCVHQFYERVSLCVVEVMSEMAGRHVEAIETWSSSEHGRCGQMVVVSPWLLWVT